MLNRRESEIMRAVYGLCGERENCLVSVYDILSMLPQRRGYTAEAVEEILRALECDDYFDLVLSERKGERMYVITLHRSGCGNTAETDSRCGAASRSGSRFRRRAPSSLFLVGLFLRAVFA